MPQTALDHPESVQKMLTRIASLGIRIHYFRWDSGENVYKRFKPEPSEGGSRSRSR